MEWLQRFILPNEDDVQQMTLERQYSSERTNSGEWFEEWIANGPILNNDEKIAIIKNVNRELAAILKKGSSARATVTTTTSSTATPRRFSNNRERSSRASNDWSKVRNSVHEKKISDAQKSWDFVINDLDQLRIEDIDLDDGRYDAAVVRSVNNIDYEKIKGSPLDISIQSNGSDDDEYLLATTSIKEEPVARSRKLSNNNSEQSRRASNNWSNVWTASNNRSRGGNSVQEKKFSGTWKSWDFVINNLDKLKIEDIDFDDGKYDAAVVRSFNTIDYEKLRGICTPLDISIESDDGSDDDEYLVASLNSSLDKDDGPSVSKGPSQQMINSTSRRVSFANERGERMEDSPRATGGGNQKTNMSQRASIENKRVQRNHVSSKRDEEDGNPAKSKPFNRFALQRQQGARNAGVVHDVSSTNKSKNLSSISTRQQQQQTPPQQNDNSAKSKPFNRFAKATGKKVWLR